VTSFIGRRRELSQVREALERYRLVTLRGVGGVGKTRLALHLAADLQRSFADGVWLAELSALRNAELLARTVAASLGLPDQGAGDPADLLADYLAERHLLLILDTCEHLVDACAKLAKALLLAAPWLRILATSREPLGVKGEQAQLISPLEVPDSDEAAAGSDSVALFADRAEAMVPGFTLTAANQQPVVQLCRRLDGIPLALELAAARLRAISIEQIVARLDDRFLLLGTLDPATTVIRRCARRSAGVMSCAQRGNNGCGPGCRCSPAVSTWKPPNAYVPGNLSPTLAHHEQLPMPFELVRTMLVNGMIER
jgi:non-specific serine/threonine protein kinase